MLEAKTLAKQQAVTTESDRSASWSQRLIVAATMLVVFLATLAYTQCWLFASLFPFSIEYEGHVLWACKQLADGLNIYAPSSLSNAPWSVVIYTPLFFAIGAPLIKLFGVSFIPLRMISIVSTVASFIGFAMLLKQSKLKDYQILVAVTLLACTMPVLHWSCMARVDMLGLAFAIFGLERFVASRWKSSMLLFALAFFTKQQYIVFPLACLLGMFIERRCATATKYGAALFGIIGCVSLAVHFATGGYTDHLMFAAGLPWEFSTLSSFLVPFLLDPKVIACLVLLTLSRHTAPATQQRLPLLLLLCSFLPVLYTMGLRGAYHNHLLCTYFALFWLTALQLRANWAYFVLVLSSFLSLNSLGDVPADLGFRSKLLKESRETLPMLRPGLRVLSEDPSLQLMTGSQPAIVDATTFTNTFSRHPAQRAALLHSIATRSYDLIVINKKDAEENRALIWPNDVVEAIRRDYLEVGDSAGNGMRQVIFKRRLPY